MRLAEEGGGARGAAGKTLGCARPGLQDIMGTGRLDEVVAGLLSRGRRADGEAVGAPAAKDSATLGW